MAYHLDPKITEALARAQAADDQLSAAITGSDPRLPEFAGRLDRALAAVAAIHQALMEARRIVAQRDGLARAVHGDPRGRG